VVENKRFANTKISSGRQFGVGIENKFATFFDEFATLCKKTLQILIRFFTPIPLMYKDKTTCSESTI
jgi:hypothetical protein